MRASAPCHFVMMVSLTTLIAAVQAEEIIPKQGLLLSNVSSFRRGGIDRYDPLERLLIRKGFDALHPKEGDHLDLGDDQERTWARVEFNETGNIARQELGRGGYVYVPIESETERVMILHGKSHGGLHVNGVPHTANVYGYDYYHIPVALREGTNGLLLRGGRRGLHFRLYDPPAAAFLLADDATLPDGLIGKDTDSWGGVIIVNTSEEALTSLTIECSGDELERTKTPVPRVPPMSFRKVAFRLRGPELRADEAPLVAHLELTDRNQPELAHHVDLKLRRRDPHDAHKVTFISQLDGSVQYFGLRPAVPLSDQDPAPAVVLSCHGASVKGIGQAAAYSAKSWLHLVAPTNRRPYGFDWEDMGRADAMEVLALATRQLRHDPSRVYLTGHSMGGHGTWHIGSLYPDRFAAIGPSAGWISYTSYASRRGAPAQEKPAIQLMLERGRVIGDPLQLKVNLKQHGIYVLHGSDDRSVPASQARQMAELLEEMHHDWFYHEEPGKGHWWSNELKDGGATCMDWPDMYDAFARHALPPRQSVRSVEFATANPGVSSRCHWLGIEAQQTHHQVSSAKLTTWPNKRQFQGTTNNVAVLSLDVSHLLGDGPIAIDLDGQTLEPISPAGDTRRLWFERIQDMWQRTEEPSKKMKGPHRYGSIKNELNHRFLFVYGTQGSAAENALIYAKARLDAESLWYRGNGGVDVVADREFSASDYPDRTVLVYGNADTNAAWADLLEDSPVQVGNGTLRVGDNTHQGSDLACLFVRPRNDSDMASVIGVTATGQQGLRMLGKQSLFQPFVRYPDCVVLRAPAENEERASVEQAGYFGLDWSVENGEFLSAAE